MKKPGDTLELGECIGTKGTRICDRQGTFDREGGPWNPAPESLHISTGEKAQADDHHRVDTPKIRCN